MKDLGHGANVDNMAKKFGKNENDIGDKREWKIFWNGQKKLL